MCTHYYKSFGVTNMAKVGFRRELLGFNREDVIEYIKKMQKDNSEKETELISSIDNLNRRNAELIDELKIIPQLEASLKISEATIEKLSNETAALRAKQAEVENISRDIAKMYLVAKSNAEVIKQSTKDSSDLAFYEINRTMLTLEEMQAKLKDIKSEIYEASQKYSNDLEYVFKSFSAAKETINNISEKVSEVISKE